MHHARALLIDTNFKIEVATELEGDVTLFIRTEEIIVSTSPMQSSARNMLRGRIVQVEDVNLQVQIKVDFGREPISTVTQII